MISSKTSFLPIFGKELALKLLDFGGAGRIRTDDLSPETVRLALLLRVSLTAPEPLHPLEVRKPVHYFLEPVVIPA